MVQSLVIQDLAMDRTVLVKTVELLRGGQIGNVSFDETVNVFKSITDHTIGESNKY